MTTRQRGQALPLGLAMILVAVLGALVLYNTGRTASDKARLANAADAAAYSGLVWQARALNFQAYTNRAMVANQVSMAQAVSLSSWTRYGRTTAQNLSAVLGGLPFVGPLAQGARAAMQTLDGFVQPVAGAMITVLDKVNRGLSASQQAMFTSSFAATPEIVEEVIRRSDASGRFTSRTAYGLGGLHENLSDWRGFTERHEPDSEAMDERAGLIMNARDDFTRKRDWKFFDGFWFYSSPITRHRVFKSGETRLVAVDGPQGRRWEWKGKDTIALQTRRLKWNGKERKHELPIGWGESHANATGGGSYLDPLCRRRSLFDFGGGHRDCGSWGKNKGAEKLAARDPVALGGYRGLQAFRTINARLLANDGRGAAPTLHEEPVLRLKVEASLLAREARSSADEIAGETFGIDVSGVGERLSSISVAELYYRRPDVAETAEKAREAANGYNPYWDVRLAPVSERERLLALALRPGAGASAGGGGSVAPGPFAPSGAGVTPSAGAVAGGLPVYVSTLAGGRAEESAAALAGDVERYAALTTADLDGFVAGAEGAADAVRDELAGTLRRAPGEILAGVAGGAIGRVEAALGGLGEVDVEAAAAEVRGLSERFADVAGVVAADIGGYLDELVQTRVVELAPDVGRVAALAEEIERAAEADREGLQRELDDLVATRDEALQLLRDEIAEHVVDVVEGHVPEWEMPLDMAHETVEAILAEYRGQLGTDALEDGVRWVFVDEEDTDVDPNEGDGYGN